MSSAFQGLTQNQIMEKTKEIGAQGIEMCVFRRDGSRADHVATHLDYEDFSKEDAKRLIDACNHRGLRLSIGAYENLIGGDPAERLKNQNHLLLLIRIACLLGGNDNDIVVGTFVGYNHELGVQDRGFEKNLMEYARIFAPIVKYAEDMGVTIAYENCPMEGWLPATTPTTYNNLPGTLAARKLMYTLIPSAAHGETYDPSHDIWQHINPSDVIESSDITRIRRIHVKTTRNLWNNARTHWGAMHPMQTVDAGLAKKAGVPIPDNDWNRHHYEPMLPGFGGSDSMDWRSFLETLLRRGYQGPFVIENEAANSSHTGSMGATVQGFKATVLCLAPILWPLDKETGYRYDPKDSKPLKVPASNDMPIVTMDQLM